MRDNFIVHVQCKIAAFMEEIDDAERQYREVQENVIKLSTAVGQAKAAEMDNQVVENFSILRENIENLSSVTLTILNLPELSLQNEGGDKAKQCFL